MFLFPNIYAIYTDYGITDITMPSSVPEDINFTVSIFVTNNSATDATISIDLNIYSPKSQLVNSQQKSISVPAHNSNRLDVNYSGPVLDLNQSTQPYLFQAMLVSSDDNPSNNSFNKYFTVTKSSSKKIPVPDIPIYFGFVLAILSIILISLNNKNGEKHGSRINK